MHSRKGKDMRRSMMVGDGRGVSPDVRPRCACLLRGHSAVQAGGRSDLGSIIGGPDGSLWAG
jgi:hypothetical protein